MTTRIDGNGLQINLKASVTFPSGIILTQFADDADPLDNPSGQIADKATGLNGHLVSWSVATAIEATISPLAGSEDDTNLGILLEENRAGLNKTSAKDVITLVITYGDGETRTLIDGVITDGPLTKSISSGKRIKTRNYKFAFENISSS